MWAEYSGKNTGIFSFELWNSIKIQLKVYYYIIATLSNRQAP